MIRRLLSLLPKSVKPILTRYYLLRTEWIGVKLHHFQHSDDTFHTHPWWGISFHLRPYTEHRLYEEIFGNQVEEIRRRRWFVNIISPWTPHRVVTDRPMWTLFIHGWRINEDWKYGGYVAPWRGRDAA